MKTLLLTARALLLGVPALLLTAPLAEAQGANFCALPRLFKLYDAKRAETENPWVQEVSVKLRVHYQWGSIDPNGGSSRVKGGDEGRGRRHNDEWRRFFLGAQAKVLRHFTLCAIWNVGGLDTRDQYHRGGWSDGVSSGIIDELYIRGNFKPLSFTLGRHKPAFMGEYRTSSANIITIERSAIINQLAPDELYGLSFKNGDAKAPLGWELGLWMNGEHDDPWAEPAFNSGDNAMLGASLSYATGERSRLYLDYMHSWRNENRPQADSSYVGPGARDILALTWEHKAAPSDRRDGGWSAVSFMAEAIAGFHLMGAEAGAENVYGFVLIPSYRFSPHFEGVLRYQLTAGSNAAAGDSRYATSNGAFAKRSDLLHGFYMGLNYYVCPEKTDTARIMLGAEYFNSQGRNAAGEKGFSGWNFSMGWRCNF